MLRSTNTGMTAVAQPTMAASRRAAFERGVLDAEVQGHQGTTPFRAGATARAPAAAIAILLAALAAAAARPRRAEAR